MYSKLCREMDDKELSMGKALDELAKISVQLDCALENHPDYKSCKFMLEYWDETREQLGHFHFDSDGFVISADGTKERHCKFVKNWREMDDNFRVQLRKKFPAPPRK